MAYTNVWSDTTPTGSEDANTIDDIFRSLKVDIEQRFVDIFAMPNFTADPLRPYGLKFTDAQSSKIFLGDNAGTPRTLIIRNKADSTSYVTFGSSPALTIHTAGMTVVAGTSAFQAVTVTTFLGTSTLTVSGGGITITGNSTITGTLGSITTLTATNIAGTLTTAAQTNVTSLGALTALAVTGDISIGTRPAKIKSQALISIANNATGTVTVLNNSVLLLYDGSITANNAVVHCNGALNILKIISQSNTNFTLVPTTPLSINLSISGTTVTVENKTGGTLDLLSMVLGTN